jgi:hypothetical protein
MDEKREKMARRKKMGGGKIGERGEGENKPHTTGSSWGHERSLHCVIEEHNLHILWPHKKVSPCHNYFLFVTL